MFRNEVFSSVCPLGALALAVVAAAAVPGLAAAQGWDWDEDIVEPASPATHCSDSSSLELWTTQLSGGTEPVTTSTTCEPSVIWS